MVVPMAPTCPPTSHERPQRGFTLVEALAALGIFAIAVLVATAFLQAHVTASRRLEVRSALVQATETTLEEIRGGLRPLASANLDQRGGFGLTPGAELLTSIKVDSGGVTDLYRVIVTSRSAAAGEPMEIAIETMVWRP
jgi:prepilin-type N-terminal cleavage/methylation domain-containing protein